MEWGKAYSAWSLQEPEIRIRLISYFARLPFDKLRPRANRGELVEGRIPTSDFNNLTPET